MAVGTSNPDPKPYPHPDLNYRAGTSNLDLGRDPDLDLDRDFRNGACDPESRRDGKRSLTLKSQEIYVPGQGVLERIAKRIPNPKAWDGSARLRPRRALKDGHAYP